MNFLLNVEPIGNLGNIFLYGAQIFLIAISAVTALLIFFWFARALYRLLFKDSAGASRAKEAKSDSSPAYSAYAAGADEEIVAVIAAAIAMAESECGNNAKFRVVSFKRK